MHIVGCLKYSRNNPTNIVENSVNRFLNYFFIFVKNVFFLHLWPGFLLFMLLFRIIFCYILQCLKKNLETLLVLLHFFTIKNFWAIGFVNCDMVYKVLICKESLKEFTKLSNYLILFSYCLVNVLCFEAHFFLFYGNTISLMKLRSIKKCTTTRGAAVLILEK